MAASLVDELWFLVGAFAGEDTVHASAWSDQDMTQAVVRADPELSGGLLLQRHTEQRSGGERFESVNVFVRDVGTGEVLLYAFDSLGQPPEPPARGRVQHGDLALERRTDRGEARTTYSATDAGYVWSKQFRPEPDAPWQRVVSGDLRRVDVPGIEPGAGTA